MNKIPPYDAETVRALLRFLLRKMTQHQLAAELRVQPGTMDSWVKGLSLPGKANFAKIKTYVAKNYPPAL